ICAMSFAGCAASRVFTDASRNSFAAPRPSQIPANWLLASSNPRLQSSIPTARLPQRKLLSSTILRRLIERWAFAAITSTNRREIERGLREGKIRGVVSTSALELGIDVGSLDSVVMAGYPGTISATWQRAGRAGRRSGSSCAVLVASSAPLDQFMVRHPDYFF